MNLDELYSELTLKTQATLALVVLDGKGIVTDRRAGRIETAVCEELCWMLSKKIKKVGDTEVIIRPGKGHRFVVVFRGKGLEGPLTDADPHREGKSIQIGRASCRERV